MEQITVETTIAAVNETYGVHLSLQPSAADPFNNRLLVDDKALLIGSLGAIHNAVLHIAKGIEIGRDIH